LNIPLPPGCTSAMYLQALETLLTAIEKFDARTVVISLGFDTYREDPFSSFLLDKATFTSIGARIGSLNKTTLVVQEGGYCIPALGSLAVNFFSGLLQQG
jgi:acetoin utilization deacetylase AcuC-like enzyme